MEPVEWNQCSVTTASFPGRSHLQSLIACSMQIWRGEAWGSGHIIMVTSGRKMVDTWGAGSDCNSSHYSSTRHWMTNAINVALRMLWPPALGLTSQESAPRFFIGYCLYVYPLSTWCHHTWPNLSGIFLRMDLVTVPSFPGHPTSSLWLLAVCMRIYPASTGSVVL